MNVTYLKDRTFRAIKSRKTEELLGYDLGSELIAALEKAFEPLDGLDMDEKQIDRIKESF